MLKIRQLTLPQFIIFSLPIILGLALGFLIAKGVWHFALILAALAPLALLFSERPFIGVILWLLLMPLSSALPDPDLMYWAIHRLLAPLTLGMTILTFLANPSRVPRLKIGLPELSIALMAVFVPISILLGPMDARQTIIKYADRMLIPFCMYLIVRLTVLRSSEQHLLQWSAFFIAASQSMIGFLSLIAAQYLPYAWQPVISGYAAGSLLNPNVFASVLGFCICILFQAAIKHKSSFVKFIFIITCGVSIIGIFLSMERAAWLAGVLVLLGLFVLYPRIMLRFGLIAAVFIITLGGVFFSNQISRAAQRIGNEGTIDDRIIVIDAMLQMIQEKPIFGWGYETLNQNIKNYYRSVGSVSNLYVFTTSHNTYLTIFTELGLVGFLLYMLPAAWLFKASFPILRQIFQGKSKHRSLLAVLWLAALQTFVISNFMDMRFFPIGVTFWWMELGLIANLVYQRTETRDELFSYPSPRVRVFQPLNRSLLENDGTR